MVRAAMTVAQGQRAGRQDETVVLLRGRVAALEGECQALRAERDRLTSEVARLSEANQRLGVQVAGLRRAAKRQAAPFSKGSPVPNPRRPGRKAGAAYGRRAPAGSR